MSAADHEVVGGVGDDGERGACGGVGGAGTGRELVEALVDGEYQGVEGAGGVFLWSAPGESGGHYLTAFFGGCLR